MKLLKKLWQKHIEFNKRCRESLKATRSYETNKKCPKCKSNLHRISYAKSIDNNYFCPKCGYEATLGL